MESLDFNDNFLTAQENQPDEIAILELLDAYWQIVHCVRVIVDGAILDDNLVGFPGRNDITITAVLPLCIARMVVAIVIRESIHLVLAI